MDSYCDRNNKTGAEANWSHIYSDWAALKDRHAILLDPKKYRPIHRDVAQTIFDLYFQNQSSRIWSAVMRDGLHKFFGNLEFVDKGFRFIMWVDDLIEVGWQLCRNSNL